jgi:hypothetical protein
VEIRGNDFESVTATEKVALKQQRACHGYFAMPSIPEENTWL